MDPNSLNYDEEALTDDGTCEYDRDKFIGTYSSISTCNPSGFWDSNDGVIEIKALAEDVKKVEVTFPHSKINSGVTFEASASGNSLVFDDERQISVAGVCITQGNPASHLTHKLTGTAVLTGTEFVFSNFNYFAVDDQGSSFCVASCDIMATKDS